MTEKYTTNKKDKLILTENGFSQKQADTLIFTKWLVQTRLTGDTCPAQNNG